MSSNATKFIKTIPMSEGGLLIRDLRGEWQLHRAGKQPSRLSDVQQQMIDAALLAGIVFGRCAPGWGAK